MQSRLIPRAIITTHTSVGAESLEIAFHQAATESAAERAGKEWRLSVRRLSHLSPSRRILRQYVVQFSSERHQAGLEEFRVAYDDQCLLQVDVLQIQRERLANSQTAAV
jgi:hypothetical protein